MNQTFFFPTAVDILYCISLSGITQWVDIYIVDEVIPLVNLAPSDTIYSYDNIIDCIL